MTRSVDFRYVILHDGADLCCITPRGGTAPSIRMDESGEIKESFSGDFLPTVYDLDGKKILTDVEISWLSDEIRPEMILNGERHPLGVYLPATVTPQETENEKYLHIEAYDRCWRIKDNYSETSVYFASDTNYLTAVESLLTACGVTLMAMTPTTATLAEAREDWEIGTSYLTIVNQLLEEINYNPLWFDASGLAIIEPAAVPSAENIEHTLSDADPETMLLPGISRETDLYQAPNVFLCICSNADKSGPLTASSENTNPQSPLSIARRGRRIVKVTRVDNIASQSELQSYADRLRDESMITGETIRVQTGLLPGFGVNDVTAIRYGEDVFSVCVERAWTMELTVGGRMSHTLERVVINLG